MVVPDGAEGTPGGVKAWSADAAAGLVGESVGAEDAGEPADPAVCVERAGSVCVEECSTWFLDGLDGRD
ncbi:hypothetical protein BKH28_03170 [Actinomyces oris]|uniref:Uncharacterized protein n=1 Tax=Actinomyces oris TaxID=544580 RepID=A0A1Q8VQT8_9ACTO|nr:hypothetical protein BKH28_03170 [Actinomyces oris]